MVLFDRPPLVDLVPQPVEEVGDGLIRRVPNLRVGEEVKLPPPPEVRAGGALGVGRKLGPGLIVLDHLASTHGVELHVDWGRRSRDLRGGERWQRRAEGGAGSGADRDVADGWHDDDCERGVD